METKTHWKKLVNPDYIGAYCIEADTTVKILSVAREIVKGEGGKSEECTVLRLEGQKPFICNRTNAKTITKLYGSPYIEDWVGKLITLFPTTTKVAGETVECLRIRPTAPVIKSVDYTPHIKAVESCTTLEQLQQVYESFTKEQRAATLAAKDKMKAKLSTSTESLTTNQPELI